jgi:hypothetical protein
VARCVAHAWKRVPVRVVTVLDEPEVRERFDTYNSECRRCGAKAWLHWPSGSLAAEKVTRR